MNNFILPKISREFEKHLQQFFQLYEVNSSGFVDINQLEKEWPSGVPGLPEKTLYFLRLLTQHQNGHFSYKQLSFAVQFLLIRKFDCETLNKVISRLQKPASTPDWNNQFLSNLLTTKPITIPRRSSGIHIMNSTNSNAGEMTSDFSKMRRSNENINSLNQNNDYKCFRTQSLQDINAKMGSPRPQYVNCVASSNENLHNKCEDNGKTNLNQLYNENQKLSNQLNTLKKELHYYRRLVNTVEQEKSLLVQNLLAHSGGQFVNENNNRASLLSSSYKNQTMKTNYTPLVTEF